jgi:hypothetical protein
VMGQLAGDLLAKDVRILVDRVDLAGSPLLAAANAALDQMGVGPGFGAGSDR